MSSKIICGLCALAGGAERRAPFWIADQSPSARRQRRGIAGRNQHSRFAVPDQLGDSGNISRDASKPLDLRLHQNVGQAVAITIGGNFGGKDEQIGRAIGSKHFGLRTGAPPFDPVG